MIHDRTAEQRTAHECVLSYMRGFADGATVRAKRTEFTEHKTRADLKRAYEWGYDEGVAARKTAHADACVEFKYELTGLEMLR